MPSDRRVVIALRGSEEYEAALDRLCKAVGAANRNDLAEIALASLADAQRIKLPARVTPPGWSRLPKDEPAPKPKRPKGRGKK